MSGVLMGVGVEECGCSFHEKAIGLGRSKMIKDAP